MSDAYITDSSSNPSDQSCLSKSSTPPSKWSCSKCTMHNHLKTKKCIMCGEARRLSSCYSPDIYQMSSLISTTELSEDKNLANVNSSKWSCQVCTYLNFPKSKKCTQCLSSRSLKSHDHPRNSPCRSSSPASSLSSNCGKSNESNEKDSAKHGSKSSSEAQKQHHEHQQHSHSQSVISCTNSNTNSNTNTSSHSDSYYNDRNRSSGTLALQCGLKWSCAACTYENWDAAKRCVICGTQKRIETVVREETSQSNRCISPLIVEEGNAIIGDQSETKTGKCDINNKKNESCEAQTESRESYLNDINRCNDDLYNMVLIPNSSRPTAKRVPSDVSRYLAADIMLRLSNGLRQRKGEFACYFVSEFVTFTLPAEVEDFMPAIQERLFDEILDRDVQKELEEESSIINWSLELTERYGSRLYALWNRSTGDCLLDSVLQATWGIFDRENILRKALSDSLLDATSVLFSRFKEAETLQANLLHFTLDDDQWQEDWAVILSLANQPGQSLEQIHIFTLAHIMRRPIIVYAIKIVKSFRGETLGYAGYEGIYLPLLWEASFTWKSPIALGYTRGHFTALVAIEPDHDAHMGAASANLRTSDDSEMILLPLVTSEHQLLPIHFLKQSEIGREEEIMRQYVDCCMTAAGLLCAKQKIPKKPLLVAQMMEEWMDFYRNLTLSSPLSLSTSLPHNVIDDNIVQDFSSDADSDQE